MYCICTPYSKHLYYMQSALRHDQMMRHVHSQQSKALASMPPQPRGYQKRTNSQLVAGKHRASAQPYRFSPFPDFVFLSCCISETRLHAAQAKAPGFGDCRDLLVSGHIPNRWRTDFQYEEKCPDPERD